MVETKKPTTVRKKPKFLRTDWHKKIRLGKGVKKNQKWHGAKGRQNKFRLGRKGRGQRPKVGWGATNDAKGFIDGVEAVRVENMKEMEAVKKLKSIQRDVSDNLYMQQLLSIITALRDIIGQAKAIKLQKKKL